MSSFARHQKLIDGYFKYNHKTSSSMNDADVLRAQHKFIRDESDDIASSTNWETRMAIKYYKRLHKEFALADFSRYREEKIGLRWRTEAEVVSGKGQFECGNVTSNKKCSEQSMLHSYEVNFKYLEEDKVKNELVKLRLCPKCARKLPGASTKKNLKRDQEERKTHKHKKKKKTKRKRSNDASSQEAQKEDEDEGEEDLDQTRETSRVKYSSSSENTNTASVWTSDAPKAKSEEDEMDAYLQGLFF